jgi:acyl-CoA thioester hydrolase
MDSLEEFPVIITVPVHWGDQDSFGHVNNVIYLRWAETARVEYLTRAGIWRHYEETGVGPIVANINCDYRRALQYPETVRVGARVAHIGNSSIRMTHKVVSSDGEVAAELSTVLVLYDYRSSRPVPVSPEMRDAIAKIEARE